MNGNRWVRQAHRWLAIAFTAAVLVNIVLNLLPRASEELALRVGMVTLIPIGLLLVTGLYLFVLPYITTKDGGTRTDT